MSGQTPAKGSGGWNVSLYHCSPGSAVFESIMRPWVVYAEAEERLRNPYLNNYDGSNAGCGVCCQLTLLPCVYVSKQRTKIREKYGIQGSPTGDFCTATWCTCCALVQHNEEIASRSAKMRPNNGTNLDTTGYQPNTNSMYMPERGSWYQSADLSAPRRN